MIYILTAFSNIKTGLSFEYGALPICAAFYFLITLPQSKIWIEAILILVGIICLISGGLFSNIDAFKELIFISYLITGIRLIKNEIVNERIIKISIMFWVLIGLLEYIPSLYEIKAALMTKSLQPNVVRGGSSLATEPSYFALSIGCLMIMQLTVRGYAKLSFQNGAIYLISFLLTKSTMSLLFLPLLLFSTKKSYIFLVFIPIIVIYHWEQFSSSRYIRIFLVLLENRYNGGVFTDASAGSRLLYIIKDIQISSGSFFLPNGPGTYEPVMKLKNGASFVSEQAITEYDFSMSGSLIGRFLVNYGFMFILGWVYFLFYLLRKCKVPGLVTWITVSAVGMQMISLVSPIFPLMLGSLLFYVTRSYNNTHES